MGCSINGCILFTKNRECEELALIEEKLRTVILAAEERGRDSYGIVAVQSDGEIKEIKSTGRPSSSLNRLGGFVTERTTLVLNNNRAEPTTEYVSRKMRDDIQPFGDIIYVTHNGTIANDTEMERKYGLRRKTNVDSGILPPLLEKIWDGTFEELVRILRDEIIGSYALAIASTKTPNRLYLACNYKPLFLEFDKKLDALFFSSLEIYLGNHGKPLWSRNPMQQLNPYSLFMVSTDKTFKSTTLWRTEAVPHQVKKKALVVCSGGLDSTAAAKVMIDRGFEVTLLHFRYRHRAEQREAECVKRLGIHLGCDVLIVETDIFKNVIRHSRLTGTEESVITDRGGQAGAEFAHEWVPARNLIFLSIATGIAEAYGYEFIVLGNNLEESGAYPDNEMMFIMKLNEVLPYATNLQKRVKIEMPVGNLMKHEIVKLARNIGVPLDLTWSCYEGGQVHCGQCGPCFMRRKGFEINGLSDTIPYATP